MKQESSLTRERPPIVAIVGHIDHGKSTLLDYIRKSNTTEGEAGGITQHLSAYVAEHTNATGTHKITFLDTPGHEAFRAMRSRGLEVADVAVLVVAADDGAKPQTLEAMKLIDEIKIPYIVALTKIDKPGADVEKAKMSLLENGIYLEGLGGEVPYMPISSKTGEGIPELLDLILLAGELEGLSADPSLPGSGLVIEAHLDQKRGNTATLIVQNGSVESGEYIVSGESFAPVRIMENFLGKPVTEAGPGSPVRIVGFSKMPTIGAIWKTVESKKEAEIDVAEWSRISRSEGKTRPSGPERPSGGNAANEIPEDGIFLTLPLVIKTDFAGTGDAVVHELEKLPVHERLDVRVVARAAGPVSESDVRLVGSGKHPGIIAGFNVKVEREAAQLAERLGVEIGVFSIIYELTTWLEQQMDKHRPRANMEEQTGSAKVLKVFSTTKGKVVLGGKVEDGALSEGEEVKLMRRDVELGRGTIVSLQTQKNAVKKVEAGNEFGAMVKTDIEPAAGDTLHAFEVVNK
ncbi:MAG: translation initiation factor IF-2 [Candidatus Adlerbacteria bacterium]